MKSGDIITVYQDPITQLKVDGKAQLLHRLPYSDKGFETWELIFLDDGMQAIRIIKV